MNKTYLLRFSISLHGIRVRETLTLKPTIFSYFPQNFPLLNHQHLTSPNCCCHPSKVSNKCRHLSIYCR